MTVITVGLVSFLLFILAMFRLLAVQVLSTAGLQSLGKTTLPVLKLTISCLIHPQPLLAPIIVIGPLL